MVLVSTRQTTTDALQTCRTELASTEEKLLNTLEECEAADMRLTALTQSLQSREEEEAVLGDRIHALGQQSKQLEAQTQEQAGKLEALRQRPLSHAEPDLEQLLALGRDLSAVWNAPQADPALKQRLAGLLLEEVLCDVDASGQEVILVLHWQGGRHSEVRMRKPEPGQHRYQASPQVHALLREHSPSQSTQQLAALLNQHGLKTGHGHSWDAERVRGFMAKHGIGPFAGSGSSAPSLSLTKAARRLGVNDHTVRRLITQGLLPCTQRAAHAKCQIPAEALQSPQVQAAVQAALERRRRGSHSPSPPLHSKCESETKGV